MEWKIGDVTIPNQVVVAPMAGVTNSAFRIICKEYGAGLVVCEMISDRGIMYKNKKTLDMMFVDPKEHPMSIQIFGGTKETLVQAAKFVDQHTAADIIDINMGCPVNKVVKTDAGARWLLDPKKVYEMVSYVTDAVKKPVTVKMRTGWDEDHIYAVENALAAERAGASASQCMAGLASKCIWVMQTGIFSNRWPRKFTFPLWAMGMFAPPKMLKRCLMKWAQTR